MQFQLNCVREVIFYSKLFTLVGYDCSFLLGRALIWRFVFFVFLGIDSNIFKQFSSLCC